MLNVQNFVKPYLGPIACIGINSKSVIALPAKDIEKKNPVKLFELEENLIFDVEWCCVIPNGMYSGELYGFISITLSVLFFGW